MTSKRKGPIFVVGCPRSGTTLLYDMLLSSGGFAVYRTEARVFDMLLPRFGDLGVRKNKEQLLNEWLPSEFFRRSGLNGQEFKAKILSECRNAGDFLRILMESIAEKQEVDRWAECTPTNILFMVAIKRAFPEALFIHIIRDGRDAALSLEQQGWVRPLPWDKNRNAVAAGIFWEWIVGKGREIGQALEPDYLEVHFEDLMSQPAETLARIGLAINHNLDYEQVQQRRIGTVTKPNTSFHVGSEKADFNPVGRWKLGYSQKELARFESLLGPFLKRLGYFLATPAAELSTDLGTRSLRTLYRLRFESRHWLKTHTPLGRIFTNSDLLRDYHAQDRDRLAPKVASR